MVHEALWADMWKYNTYVNLIEHFNSKAESAVKVNYCIGSRDEMWEDRFEHDELLTVVKKQKLRHSTAATRYN